MSQRTAINVTSIITYFEEKFNIQISPGTIYPIFKKLEKKGYIKKLPNRTKTLYVLTGSGRTMLMNIQYNLDEVQSFMSKLIIK